MIGWDVLIGLILMALSFHNSLNTCIQPIGAYSITHYTCSAEEGTSLCITASGKRPVAGYASSYVGNFKFGTELIIENVGRVRVEDTGNGYDDRRPWIDVYTDRGRTYALRQGVQLRKVAILACKSTKIVR